MKQILTTILIFACGFVSLWAQVNSTANDAVPPFDGPFGFGSNMGYFPPWDDEQLADIAAGNPEAGIIGAGVRSLRPALPEHFLEQWGYDVRINTFQHYADLGIENNTVFIGYPRNSHRDTNYYCPTHQSELFANMYTDIWDNGENGTPVNDENYYALYLYKMVTRYKDYVTFWEIWNEPDFDYSGSAWKPADIPGNWWVNNPDPCDYALRAPVFHYVRLLRISYEVIKSVDPTAYVTTGGFGFPSFLDAVLRNTDNPLNGLPNDDYPLKGGAYFDVMSFHSYPHVDGSMRDWDQDIEDFVYRRHSDAAAKGFVDKKKEFQAVLEKYGYGLDLPKKHFIVTECNIPRVAYDDYIGSDEAQRNFIIKSLIEAQKNDVLQFCVFNLGDSRKQSEASNEFQLMGLYKHLSSSEPYNQVSNNIAVAYKTTSDMLYNSHFDPQQTEAMLIDDKLRGAAFAHPDGSYTYVLWTATIADLNELATRSYSFPPIIDADTLLIKQWDYSSNPQIERLDTRTVQLSSSPVFINVKKKQSGNNNNGGNNGEPPVDEFKFEVYPNPYVDSTNLIFQLKSDRKVSLSIYNSQGHLIQEFYKNEPLAAGVYQENFATARRPGVYICKLTVNDQVYTYKVVRMYDE